MTRTLGRLYQRGYNAVNYRLRSFAGGRFASLCRPTSICLLMTERCNARCVHCDIWKNRGKEDTPTADEWKAALSDLRSWLGPVHVVFTGGEALLVPHTVEVVEHAVSLGLMVEILTHGYWNDQTRIVALARAKPWRITISLDGLGDTHSLIRGREGFADRTRSSIETLTRLRGDEGLPFQVQLKTVIMRQNLGELTGIARFAAENRLLVFYQPIEQNYNTAEDPNWFRTSANWPEDADKAVEAVEKLLAMKLKGAPHMLNSEAQFRAMIAYFRNPAASRVAIQSHAAHERQLLCAALSMIQVQSSGDVLACLSQPAIGNIRTGLLSRMWTSRPHWWETGCCLSKRLAAGDRARGGEVTVPARG